MKRGHVTGHKKERKPSNFWYNSPECEAILRQLDAEWETKQQQHQQETSGR